MTWVDALVLGLVQGLTEFLPISSSGHLVLAQEVLGVSAPGAALEIAVHLGTLLSVLFYYRRDVVDIVRDVFTRGEQAMTGWMVVVATVPTVVIALLAKDQIEQAFDTPRIAAIGLLITGAILLLTPLARRRLGRPGYGYALLVGCAQVLAIMPGVSRSGSTISTAMFLGDEPVRAARFSFLMSIPAISGASVLLLADGGLASGEGVEMLLLAAAVAFTSGLAAIEVLIQLLGRGKLAHFGPYCVIVGVAAWFLL
jgi:undecaprenyl-diphosphatase